MKKSNKVLVILIVLIILLLGVGGAGAYAYFATDLLKSDKELFFKYLSQLNDEENPFIDSNITKFKEKKQDNAFTNQGSLTVNAQFPSGNDENLEKILNKVNELSINFEGNTDKKNKKVEQNIELDYGNDVSFPINYRQVGNIYGLQTKYVGSKYIAIENNNLKDLATKMGMDSSEIPDRIEFEQKENIKFTPEEIEQLKEKYGAILKEIAKENFAKEETQVGTKYILTLSGEESKNLLISILQTVQQDSILTNKINTLAQATGDTLSSNVQNEIQEIIDKLNEKDSSEMKELKIYIGQSNKKLNQILFEYGTDKVEVIKNKSNDTLNYIISAQIVSNDKNQLEDTSTTETYLKFSCTYNGLSTLENINEIYECTVGVNINNENLEYVYELNNNIQFIDSVNIENLNEDTALILNDYDSQTINNLLTAISERLVSVNQKLMQKLGLEESENPLIYSNPITALGIQIYNMASNTINDSMNQITDTEKQAHNSMFERYQGDQSGSAVNAMLNSTLNYNLAQTDENKKIKIILDGNEILGINDTSISTRVDSRKKYSVVAKYDGSTELITEMNIISK